MFEEKRKSIRIKKPLAVQFGVRDGESLVWDTSMINDISETGICLRTGTDMRPGDICTLKIRMPTRPQGTLEVNGRVISSAYTKQFHIRVEFLPLDEEQKSALREYIAWALVNERGGK